MNLNEDFKNLVTYKCFREYSIEYTLFNLIGFILVITTMYTPILLPKNFNNLLLIGAIVCPLPFSVHI